MGFRILAGIAALQFVLCLGLREVVLDDGTSHSSSTTANLNREEMEMGDLGNGKTGVEMEVVEVGKGKDGTEDSKNKDGAICVVGAN